MANTEHVKRLLGGVGGWNKWRREQPKVRPDLTRADLAHADLRGANLRGANLSGANLSDADLRDATLRDSILRDSILRGANFAGADLRGAELSGANFSRANLTYANLWGADLSGAALRGAELRGANLTGTDLTGTDLARASLTGAQLTRADLRGANLRYADLTDANLEGLTVDAVALARIPVVLQGKWGPTWNIKVDKGGLLQLPVTPKPHIERSIEFPPEYKAAGISILSHFGEILRSKYADLEVKVTIEQEGNTVTMVVSTEDGRELETIEKALEQYGLVVRGQMAVGDFLPDPHEAMRLETQLELAKTQLKLQERFLEHQRADIDGLRALVGRIAERDLAVNVYASPTANAEATAHTQQAFNFTTRLPTLQASLSELTQALPEQDRPKELAKAASDLQALEGETEPEEVKPRLSRVRKLLEGLGDEKSAVSKAVRGAKRGVEIAQELARGYNAVAEWCGAPVVPRVLVGKGE